MSGECFSSHISFHKFTTSIFFELPRLSSSAVRGHNGETYEESPIEQRKFVAYTTLQEQVHELAVVSTPGVRSSKIVLEVALQANSMGEPSADGTIERIARRVLHPEVVMNLVPSLGHR